MLCGVLEHSHKIRYDLILLGFERLVDEIVVLGNTNAGMLVYFEEYLRRVNAFDGAIATVVNEAPVLGFYRLSA